MTKQIGKKAKGNKNIRIKQSHKYTIHRKEVTLLDENNDDDDDDDNNNDGDGRDAGKRRLEGRNRIRGDGEGDGKEKIEKL